MNIRTIVLKLCSVCVIPLMLLCISACQDNSASIDDILSEVNTGNVADVAPVASSSINPNLAPTAGSIFPQTGYKIKAVMTPQKLPTFDKLTFEVYVDSAGNGNGLVGYKSDVYDVIITEDKVYIKVADNVAIQVTDITGHMIPTALDLSGVRDLTTEGFGLLDGAVVSYARSDESFVINNTYQPSESTFSAPSIVAGNTMSLEEVVTYILNIQTTGYLSPEDKEDVFAVQVLPPNGSFWNNSWLGVTVHGTIYSLGDYCNPDTYFDGGVTPEGMSPIYSHKADEVVATIHITYISSDGRTEIATTEGYVQAFSTSCDFSFLGIKRGDNEEELRITLGFDLPPEEYDEEGNLIESDPWSPLLDGWEAIEDSADGYLCKYGDTEFLFHCSNGFLDSIKISRPLRFV